MAKFYKVQRFAADPDLMIPVRGTERSAGYDFQVAEDIIIPSYMQNFMKQKDVLDLDWEKIEPATLAEVGPMIKERGLKPTLVSTGMKCQLADNEYLELTVRSSSPLKYLLILANGVGIIDADYYNSPETEGEIFFPLINLSPYPIKLNKGERIGQGIIHKYYTVDNDVCLSKSRNGGFGSTGQK